MLLTFILLTLDLGLDLFTELPLASQIGDHIWSIMNWLLLFHLVIIEVIFYKI